MKKTIALGIVFLLVVMSFTSISGIQLNENIIIPSYKGNTLYVGGSGEGNYSSIQDAVDNASDGDAVFVYDDSSPYYEQINVTKSINLIGEDKDTTVIDSDCYSTVLISANKVILTKFTIKNSGEEDWMYYQCIYVTSDNNVISNNNVISKNKWYREGIRLDIANNNEISGNYISNNYHGISVVKSINTIISDNIVNSNSISGIGIFNDDWDWYNHSNTKIIRNNISNNKDGIYIYSCKYVLISDNNIFYNDEGLRLGSSSFNTITDNTISNNFDGIYIGSYSNDNNIYHNNFIDNTDNVYDEGDNIWDDGKYGNYWYDYEERYPDAKPRLLFPWMWDTPYEIPSENNTDNCPLVKQWPNSASIDMPRDKSTNNILFWSLLERFSLLQKLIQL